MSNQIIDTPINLFIKENKLSFKEDEEVSLIELNYYPLKIFTNEILEGCKLGIRRPGFSSMTVADEALVWSGKRLVKFEYDSEKYWGFLEETVQYPSSGIYRADLYKYEPLTQKSNIPGKNKITNYLKTSCGELEGSFSFDSTTSIYKFSPSKLKIIKNNTAEEVSSGVIGNIRFQIETDLTNIYEPPQIDDQIIPPETINIVSNGEITVIDDIKLPSINETLSFTSYDNETKKYFYKSEEIDGEENSKIINYSIHLKLFEEDLSQYEIEISGVRKDENEEKISFTLILDSNFTIDYSSFSFSQIFISKENFLESQDSEINFYYGVLSKDYLDYKAFEKILIGVVRENSSVQTMAADPGTEENNFDYMTNALKINVLPSIKTIDWDDI